MIKGSVKMSGRSGGVYGSSGASNQNCRGSNIKPQGKSRDLSPKQCKIKMLKLLASRDYSVLTMRQKLEAAGFEQDAIEQAIEYGVKSKLLDDKRYAELYVSTKKSIGWGRQRIERELANKGVNCNIIPGYPECVFSSDDELKRAIELVRKHHTAAKNPRDSHYRYLISKGFSPAIAAKALKAAGI